MIAKTDRRALVAAFRPALAALLRTLFLARLVALGSVLLPMFWPMLRPALH